MSKYEDILGADSVHEECGVFGIYDMGDGLDVSRLTYYGLYALQHRGQESCGIAVNNLYENDKIEILQYKDMGLVQEVFNNLILNELKGRAAVGHVRYTTAGSSSRMNAQPLVSKYQKGTFALVHNGNLVNVESMRKELEDKGAIFQTNNDSEIIAHLMAKERIKTNSTAEAMLKLMGEISGAYSIIILTPKRMVVARDPQGFKPLCIGKRDNAYILASETCALDTVGAEFIRDVRPGEIVTITENGIESSHIFSNGRPEARCVFEYIYFARPDSVFDGVGVYHSRIYAGRCLAKDSPVDADIVVGVPESGNAAALGYSMESGIPYSMAFVKNSYVGRTFIKPKQSSRESAVRVKLNVLKEAVNGKRVIMIDDSIVRGTTSNLIVNMLREAGAREVHVKVSAPPFLYPCYFGTDIPSSDQLIAWNRTVEEICSIIGADSLSYLKVERLKEMAGMLPVCTACFTGDYPLDPPSEDIRGSYEK